MIITLLSALATASGIATLSSGGEVAVKTPKVAFSAPQAVIGMSGAVWDAKSQAVWSLGDAGGSSGGAMIGRTDPVTGKTDVVAIADARNTNWEAMTMDESGKIWIADVGDNTAKRSTITLYQIDPADYKGSTTTLLKQKKTITVAYADGPRDVEAAVVRNGRLFLIEKDATSGKARIAAVDVGPKGLEAQRAIDLGSIDFSATIDANGKPILPMITDAAIGPEGELYLLDYSSILKVSNWTDKGSDRKIERVGKLPLQIASGQVETLIVKDGELFIGTEIPGKSGGSIFVKVDPKNLNNKGEFDGLFEDTTVIVKNAPRDVQPRDFECRMLKRSPKQDQQIGESFVIKSQDRGTKTFSVDGDVLTIDYLAPTLPIGPNGAVPALRLYYSKASGNEKTHPIKDSGILKGVQYVNFDLERDLCIACRPLTSSSKEIKAVVTQQDEVVEALDKALIAPTTCFR
jgi:hypothetical protein